MNEIKNVRQTSRDDRRRSGKRSVTENLNIMATSFAWYFNEAIAKSLSGLGNAILFVSPFLMLFIGEFVFADRGYWAMGGEIALAVLLVGLGFGLRSYAKVSGNDRSDMPVPYRRFTRVDEENGQVDVEYDRVQEMILYMADLEDWFDRNGYK